MCVRACVRACMCAMVCAMCGMCVCGLFNAIIIFTHVCIMGYKKLHFGVTSSHSCSMMKALFSLFLFSVFLSATATYRCSHDAIDLSRKVTNIMLQKYSFILFRLIGSI